MSNIIGLLIVWSIGVLLGGLFFSGLWWTVQKSVSSGQPALWLLTSLLLRMSMTLAGFYLVLNSELGDSPWQRLLLCLLGFISARIVIAKVITRKLNKVALPNKNKLSGEGTQHAP